MMSSSKQEMLQALLREGFAAATSASGGALGGQATVDPQLLSGIESCLLPMGFSKQQVNCVVILAVTLNIWDWGIQLSKC